MAPNRNRQLMKRRRIKRSLIKTSIIVVSELLKIVSHVVQIVLQLTLQWQVRRGAGGGQGRYVHGRDTTTLRSRARRLIHPVYGANSLSRWINAGIGHLADDL